MSRKKYSCDFETTTDPEDCRVWAYGWMEIGNKKNAKIGNSLDEFMSWIIKCQGDCFFHNLKFDGSFIVSWLLRNGWTHDDSGREKTFQTVISDMGQWYIIDICCGYSKTRKATSKPKKKHTVIYDSLKKLPFPVKVIAKSFKLPIEKGDIDYNAYRPKGHEITLDELKYINNDIEIVADALFTQFEQGLDRITAGSDSLKGFKDVVGKKRFEALFPVFSIEMDNRLRKAYKGGFTWVNDRFQGKEVGEGMVFDVNSLYPSQMRYRDLPWGIPIEYVGAYQYDSLYPLWIGHIRCEFEVKEGHIPTIQLKKNKFGWKETEYLKTSEGEIVDLYLTNVDWDLIQEHYDLYNIEYVSGWKFRSRNDIFNSFIDKWMYIKVTSEGAIKQLAKLMLNSLYGKFCSNPNVTGKEPYLKEDGTLAFRDGDEEFKDPIYTPMGTFITSWARYTTITTAQKVFDRILYCDTDSIHILGLEIPEAIAEIVDPDKLGYWKHESNFRRAKFIRQKTYVEEEIVKPYGKWVGLRWIETNVHLNVKCAGMSEGVKKKVTFENFEVGFKASGKLVPRQVPGGVVLIDSEFTLVGAKEKKQIDLEEMKRKAFESALKAELAYDWVKDQVKEHGYIMIPEVGSMYHTDYKRVGRSERMKYFRKKGLPIDVWCEGTGIKIDELWERLGVY